MAFTYTNTTATKGTEVFGAKKVSWGGYASAGGSTGGDIGTGLSRVDHITLSPKGSAVAASEGVVNETLPLHSGDVTIVTIANQVGTWFAIGE